MRKPAAFQRRRARQSAEGVAAALRIDERVVVDGSEHRQVRDRAGKQLAQVVVLAEERVKAAVHRQRGAVGQSSVQPPTRPPR